MSFTPDSKHPRRDVERQALEGRRSTAGAPTEIPFEVDVVQALGPEVQFEYPHRATRRRSPCKQIRDAVPSPDGKRLAFVALDRLYVMDWPERRRRERAARTSERRRVPAGVVPGRPVASRTRPGRSATAAHLYKRAQRTAADAAAPDDAAGGVLQQPGVSPDGQRIVARARRRRANFRDAARRGGADGARLGAATGGDATLIAPSGGLANAALHAATPTRIYAYGGGRGLVSMRWDGTDIKTHLRVTGARRAGWWRRRWRRRVALVA